MPRGRWERRRRRAIAERPGDAPQLDFGGLALGSLGLLALTFGIVRGNGQGWGSAEIVGTLTAGAALAHRLRGLRDPRRDVPDAADALLDAVSLIMYSGIFGSIFYLTQVSQTVQGFSPLQAGLRTLPWTGMPMLVAPLAGLFSERIGSRPLMVAGLGLQAGAIAWIAAVIGVDTPYVELPPVS